LDWLALLVTHIPDRYEQTTRYYGYYSNKSRGLRKKADTDNQLPTIIAGEMSSKQFRRNWARLIKKIYEVDPLLCPKCQGVMKIIAFIDDDALIKKILTHLGLWQTRNHDPPPENSPYIPKLTLVISFCTKRKFLSVSRIGRPNTMISAVTHQHHGFFGVSSKNRRQCVCDRFMVLLTA
jgi:hypothetical protein